ncbi:hypothetical protein M9H77_24167 [Catharanthus roseus]|uniref:Uncharacterized protein n=1 Tax=Catharanthus roseus TaxID=4058 RepID=A0ACC0AXI8_CATRO|nr:hypothetical protein M9H77_24167 [Catharanthus roseus]
MEFWASEVKSGESFKVQPGEGMVLHLSQANLGEIKKEKSSESVALFVNVDGKKLVLGTLFPDKLPQQQFDLVFDRDFELSHNWKNGNSESESEDEDIPLTIENGKAVEKAKDEKLADAKKANVGKDSAAGKQKVKIVEPVSDSGKKEEDDSDEDESMSEDDDDDSDMGEDDDESDSDDEDEEDHDSDEETPKKVETGKKRAADSAIKTPVPDKKAKVATPQKTELKKGGVHIATPHPSKQAGKTPGNKNQQTPKSGGGSHTCKSCSRSFGSENALESHKKAKHSGGK